MLTIDAMLTCCANNINHCPFKTVFFCTSAYFVDLVEDAVVVLRQNPESRSPVCRKLLRSQWSHYNAMLCFANILDYVKLEG